MNSFRSHSRRHCDQCARMSLTSATSCRLPPSAEIERLVSLSASSVASTQLITSRLNSTCSRTCQSRARATNFFAIWASALSGPPRRGFTVPIAATFALGCVAGVHQGHQVRQRDFQVFERVRAGVAGAHAGADLFEERG